MTENTPLLGSERTDQTTDLDLEPIKVRLAAIQDKPPIRWGRHDAVALIEGDIPALLREVERLRVLIDITRQLDRAEAAALVVGLNDLQAGRIRTLVEIRADLSQPGFAGIPERDQPSNLPADYPQATRSASSRVPAPQTVRMDRDDACESCARSLVRGRYITLDDVHLCRQCYYAIPSPPAASRVPARREGGDQ